MLKQDALVEVKMAEASELLVDREFVKTLLTHYKLSRYYFCIHEFLYKMAIGVIVAFMVQTGRRPRAWRSGAGSRRSSRAPR